MPASMISRRALLSQKLAWIGAPASAAPSNSLSTAPSPATLTKPQPMKRTLTNDTYIVHALTLLTLTHEASAAVRTLQDYEYAMILFESYNKCVWMMDDQDLRAQMFSIDPFPPQFKEVQDCQRNYCA